MLVDASEDVGEGDIGLGLDMSTHPNSTIPRPAPSCRPCEGASLLVQDRFLQFDPGGSQTECDRLLETRSCWPARTQPGCRDSLYSRSRRM